jgi:hypothetical protein
MAATFIYRNARCSNQTAFTAMVSGQAIASDQVDGNPTFFYLYKNGKNLPPSSDGEPRAAPNR